MTTREVLTQPTPVHVVRALEALDAISSGGEDLALAWRAAHCTTVLTDCVPPYAPSTAPAAALEAAHAFEVADAELTAAAEEAASAEEALRVSMALRALRGTLLTEPAL